jgi:DNA-binding PadR family transcriptional regulator
LTRPKADLLQGTLDMLILKALSLGPLHGYGVIQRIRRLSDELLEVEQGSLYPAVYRTRAARLDQFQVGGAGDRPQGQVLHAD